MSQTVPNKGIHSPKIRQAGYIILAALLGVLTVFDVITEDVADQIESLVLQVLAIFGFSLAGANVPKREEGEPEKSKGSWTQDFDDNGYADTGVDTY